MLDVRRSFLKALHTIAMLPSFVQTAIYPSPKSKTKRLRNVVRACERDMDEFSQEVKRLFEAPLGQDRLLAISEGLQKQFAEKLDSSNISMLPSYNHTLPTGHERGTYLALDVGGTNFRIAVVKLNGRGNGREEMQITKMRNFRIGNDVRRLKGTLFFDWMASKIEEVITDSQLWKEQGSTTLPMGLAWSFPIEQTSSRSGLLLQMGKGFMSSTDGALGQDITELIMKPCRQRGLNVNLEAILNDSSATLLSRAYQDASTRFALILGTGMNASIHLPVCALAQSKYGTRPQSWHDQAQHVLVNTELSMFGKNIFPTTRWDDHLNAVHPQPDFQPFEQLVGGRCLAEITRLVIMEAIRSAGLFDGEVPANLTEAYSFDCGIMAVFESDETPTLSKSCAMFQQDHPLSKPPTLSELQFIRQVCNLVTHRAAAYLAAGVHALWSLRRKAEGLEAAEAGHFTMGCNGSVIEKYPRFKSLCQNYIDELIESSGGQKQSFVLEDALESAIFGAAVAVCCEQDL